MISVSTVGAGRAGLVGVGDQLGVGQPGARLRRLVGVEQVVELLEGVGPGGVDDGGRGVERPGRVLGCSRRCRGTPSGGSAPARCPAATSWASVLRRLGLERLAVGALQVLVEVRPSPARSAAPTTMTCRCRRCAPARRRVGRRRRCGWDCTTIDDDDRDDDEHRGDDTADRSCAGGVRPARGPPPRRRRFSAIRRWAAAFFDRAGSVSGHASNSFSVGGRPATARRAEREPGARPAGERQRDDQQPDVPGDLGGVGGVPGRDLAAVAEAAAVDLQPARPRRADAGDVARRAARPRRSPPSARRRRASSASPTAISTTGSPKATGADQRLGQQLVGAHGAHGGRRVGQLQRPGDDEDPAEEQPGERSPATARRRTSALHVLHSRTRRGAEFPGSACELLCACPGHDDGPGVIPGGRRSRRVRRCGARPRSRARR